VSRYLQNAQNVTVSGQLLSPIRITCWLPYPDPVPKPGNRDDCGRESIRLKNTLWCMAGLILSLLSVLLLQPC